MDVGLLVITDGRKDFLEATIASAEENLLHDFAAKVLVNDSQDAEYSLYLEQKYNEFTILHNRPKAGFSGSINRGWNFLIEKVHYIFHLEEDFLFEQKIEIQEMINLLHTSENRTGLVVRERINNI